MTQTKQPTCTVSENVALAELTTFHVSARARYFAQPQSEEALIELLECPQFAALPRLILGGGSNILFTHDFDGLVIHPLFDRMECIDENQDYRFVRVEAGAVWADCVDAFLQQGWYGLENLAAIPGTVGGAVVQNVGAYGVEIAEHISLVRCYDPKTQQVLELNVNECDYGYRHSLFKLDEHRDKVILSVVLSLPKTFTARTGYKELAARFDAGSAPTAQQLVLAVKDIRARKLPDVRQLGNAGSFFKNPIVPKMKWIQLLETYPSLVSYQLGGSRVKLAAGWLIDAVGLKGERRGAVGVYDKQALVLVNYGGASGEQVKALADEVIFRVRDKFGVKLEPEPVIL